MSSEKKLACLRGGEATSHAFSKMKSKQCSHNLQNDQQGSFQQICVQY